MAKKPEKVVGKVAGKVKVKAAKSAPTMSKLERKVARLGSVPKNDYSKSSYEIECIGRIPTEIFGQLLEINENFVVFRHKKARGSRVYISRFPKSDVLRIEGAIGEASSILVVRNSPIYSYEGVAKQSKDGFIHIEQENGDSVLLNANASFSQTVNITAEEAVVKSGKPEKAGKKRSKKEEEFED